MSSKDELKRAVCEAIDRHADTIIDLGETILRNPETGFNEVKTAALVDRHMTALGLAPRTGLALTGVKGRLAGRSPGPRLAFIGELDSLRTSEHPLADPTTGAAHSCGHNAQIAGMLGAAIGLCDAKAADQLAGEIIFFAVPAEEFIDVEERMARVAKGEIEFMLGKPELVAKGHFDDVDMAMMIHTGSRDGSKTRSILAESSNGALVKQIRFLGKAAHAGSLPQLGINALNAAVIAMNAIAANRETFWEKDTIRIHPIITKGGDAVSVVPAEVTMETFRARRLARGDPRRQPQGRPLSARRSDGDGRRGRDPHDPRLSAAAQRQAPGPDLRREHRGAVRTGRVPHRRAPHRLDRHGRPGAYDAGDPPLRRRRRRQGAWCGLADQRTPARLSDAGQALGDDRDRPAPRRRRAGEGNPRKVRAGDDQGGLSGLPARPLQKGTLRACRG